MNTELIGTTNPNATSTIQFTEAELLTIANALGTIAYMERKQGLTEDADRILALRRKIEVAPRD